MDTSIVVAEKPDNRNAELQDLIDYAHSKQFSLQGSEKINRRYAYNLLRKKDDKGEPLGERVKWLVDVAVQCRGMSYAPNVQDFKALFYRWQEIVAFAQKQQKKGRHVVI